MAHLLKVNLERRGLDVQCHPWAACCDAGTMPRPYSADLVIADLDCPAPACWDGGPRLRAAFAHIPLLLVAQERPSARYLTAHRPCECLQKPFGVSEIVRQVGALFSSG